MSASSSPKLIQPLQPAQGGGGGGDSALRLALLGNPNCGKTALFNLLTGAALLIASVVAGLLWESAGFQATFLVGAGFAVTTLAGLTLLR